MKQKNFPNRKQRRRKTAYARLLECWKDGTMSFSAAGEKDSLNKSLAEGDLHSQKSKKARVK